MCATCGRGNVEHEHTHPHDHDHHHGRDHARDHDHAPGPATRRVLLEADVLAKNDRLAAENRAQLAARGIVAFNFTSAPGAGKTTLLEAVIRGLAGRRALAVIEGDQETERDAERIRATGVPVVQIYTGTGCHLDAAMVERALARLDAPDASLLLIENVGNLVCPALFDLGEQAKVLVMSVTEGEDKPLKYPHMFRAAQVLVINKMDLLPHLDFDLTACLANARRVNPAQDVFLVSARDGSGVADLARWLAREPVLPEAPADPALVAQRA